MDLFLNNKPLDITFENEKKMGEVLTQLEQELEKNRATIIEVKIDSHAIPASEFDQLFDRDISTITVAEISSISHDEVVSLFKQLIDVFESLSVKLQNIPVELQGGKDSIVLQTITQFADTLQVFFQIVPYVGLFPDVLEKTVVGEVSINDFMMEFSPILDDFLKAFKDQDTILLGDLAEYEIAPRINALVQMIKNL